MDHTETSSKTCHDLMQHLTKEPSRPSHPQALNIVQDKTRIHQSIHKDPTRELAEGRRLFHPKPCPRMWNVISQGSALTFTSIVLSNSLTCNTAQSRRLSLDSLRTESCQPQTTQVIKQCLYKTGRPTDETFISTDLTLIPSIRSILWQNTPS
jgi:hypothetical protein